MNISALFISRPIMTTLVMLTILLFGIVAYRLLPVSDLPNVDFPTIDVSASLPGANPDTMASSVATTLEKEFSTIAGIDSMSSTSSQGTTRITLQFSLNRDIDAAAQDVQSAIARCLRHLPDMPSPPSFRKVNPADQAIIMLVLTSPNLPMSALDELGQTLISPRISTVEGVAQVQVYGSQKYAVRIELDPSALAARGVGLEEVAAAINQQNVNLPTGSLSNRTRGVTIQAEGQLLSAEKYRPIIVAYRNGQPVRLGDLGVALDSVENDRTAAWRFKDGGHQRAVILAVQRQPGTNTVQVAKAVRELLPSFQERLPAGVELEVLRDNSEVIRESAHDVQFTLLLTLVLVVLVIFLFLRNLSATLIPSLTLPLSIIGTFAVMYLLDYSLDNLSLMALTLAVGFVVDDAIVMLENIVRHLEMGKTRMQAAFDGAREIGFTIVSMTVSLAAVFIPVLFMSGLVGRLFREFAVTIGVAVLISGFISLTLTPMLGSRFLRDPRQIRHGFLYRAMESVFNGSLRLYGWSLSLVLRQKIATLVFSLAILAATAWLALNIPQGFIPSEDRGFISIRTEAAQDSAFEAMVEYQLALAAIVQADPNVDRFMCNVAGGPGGSLVNNGSLFVFLKERRERTRTPEGRPVSADDLVKTLRGKLAVVPGVQAYVANPPVITLGARSAKSLYQFTLTSAETTELYEYGTKLEQDLKGLPDRFIDISSDLQLKNPQLKVEIDRDQASTLGVSPQQIESTLYYAYGTRQVSNIYAPNDQYQVIMELAPQFQTDPSVLSMLYVRSTSGKLIPLRAVTKLREEVGPLSINHTGQLPSVTISFNLPPGRALGDALKELKAMAAADMPKGVSASFPGTAQAFQDSISSMWALLILAVVVIYIVLGILYESFYHPITILSALPFAGFGALLTLTIFNAELSIYALVGIIMLVGLVKKNGIMMVDFAIASQRDHGKDPTAAIHEACLIRFRPIMMTTMAALMAGIPIALGYGAGGEARQPLGLAVVGGLLFSQTLTLFVTPVFYVVMEWLSNFVRGVPQDSSAAPRPAARPAAESVA